MNKEQSIHYLWSQFDIPAYDENSVPDFIDYPFIAYSVSTAMLDSRVSLTANIYYRSTSWKEISEKVEEIALYLSKGVTIKLDTGYSCFYQGEPFAQRMYEPGDDMVKRVFLSIDAEFLTPY